jgi:hypothetical protein
MSMKHVLVCCALGAAALASADVASGQSHRREQDAALEAVRSGRSQPLPQLERHVVSQVRGDYLGRPEYNPDSNVYRMKFMREGSMIWIDVDGRTGRILRRSGGE